jgi:UDP-N-acetylglucosamine:LPS N-acetylglucosamine transferase
MRYYMQLGDFFIGKPGPGSVSEAVHQGLPVIVVRNAWTMPQERYNAEWIDEQQVGLVLDSFKSIRGGVEQFTARAEEYRANVRRIHNRAVFEIPEILDEILSRSPIRISVDLLQHLRAAERLHLS